jgi:hydroxylamine dehydrogenase
MKIVSICFLIGIISLCLFPSWAPAGTLSEATETCLECHETVTPGIAADWKNSRHARVSPGEALKKPKLERRMSVSAAPDGMEGTAVGCAECHTLNSDKNNAGFEHNGYDVHIVVSPRDCAACHPQEVAEFGENLMSKAYPNLMKNPVFKDLMDKTNAIYDFKEGKVVWTGVDGLSQEDSCLSCHGTKITVTGMKERETDMGGMTFPVLSGWPNGGVGRINPDGSEGSCASCHTRHAFSIEMARKPATCSECHKGPDVPAYRVYQVSKHGNLYASMSGAWDFNAVPWTAGKDFSAPTCAVCHASLIVNEAGEMVARRSHQMNDRSPWRLLGLIYAHPHPKAPDTTIIVNKAGLPLPTELTGEPVLGFLIDEREQDKRGSAMKAVCLQCHATQWVENHYTKMENTIKTSNAMTLAATKILLSAWEKRLAQKDSLFDESIERMWVEQWLFYANSTRFASAMGGADYGAFAEGRWHLSKTLQQMADWVSFLEAARPAASNVKEK